MLPGCQNYEILAKNSLLVSILGRNDKILSFLFYSNVQNQLLIYLMFIDFIGFFIEYGYKEAHYKYGCRSKYNG